MQDGRMCLHDAGRNAGEERTTLQHSDNVIDAVSVTRPRRDGRASKSDA